MKSVSVLKLGGNEEREYVGITPAAAVVAAHAQSLGDNNTWDYWRKYSGNLEYGKKSVLCGDYCALTGNDDVTQEMPAVAVCIDCGRVIPEREPGACTNNYAVEPEFGGLVCHDCCGYRDKGEMIMTGQATMYLDIEQGKWERTRHSSGGYWSRSGKVTNWPGTLSFACSVSRGRHNIAGVRYDVHFVGADGYVWWGVQYGDYTQITHCKRTKERTLQNATGGTVTHRVFPEG